VTFAAISLCVVSQRVFIVVSVYFVIDSVRKLLDTPSCTELLDARFDAFTAVIQVEVFWVVTPCNVVVGYQRFGGPCCFQL
jgi:hypothetical protein